MATDSVYSLDFLVAFKECEQGTISIQQLAWVIAEKLEELRSWASVMGETLEADNFARLYEQFAFVAGDNSATADELDSCLAELYSLADSDVFDEHGNRIANTIFCRIKSHS